MKNIILWLGIILWLFSFFSGFEFLEQHFGLKESNTLTKDSVSAIVATTWIMMAILAKGEK